VKNRTLLKKSLLQSFFSWKHVSDKVDRHLFVYLSVYKWLLGRPLICENLADTDPRPCKTRIVNLFSLVAPQL